MNLPRTESEKFNTQIIVREDLERDEDFEKLIIAEEQNTLLYKTIFWSLLVLILNVISW